MSTITRFQDVIWEEPTWPPRPLRTVLFSLMTLSDGSIYFVNNSKEILTRVRSDSYGFIDDSLVGNNPCFSYENVLVNEAVLVEQYDMVADSDFVLGFKLYIESSSLGNLCITPKASKGGVKQQSLLYDTLTTPRYVSMQAF